MIRQRRIATDPPSPSNGLSHMRLFMLRFSPETCCRALFGLQRPQPKPVLPSFLRPEQLLERRVAPQRRERRVEVHHSPPRVPLGERFLYQRHSGIALADHGIDPRPPHGVPAVAIAWAHRLELPVDAEGVSALALPRRNHAEKT